MGIYGSRVQGEEAAEAALASTKATAKFGSKVLGSKVDQRTEEEVQEDRAAARAEEALNKVPVDADGELEARLQEYASEDGYVSIGDLKEILDEMPHALDRMIAWERERADGPRIGALQHFLKIESQRDGGPRAAVQAFLEKALARARSNTPD